MNSHSIPKPIEACEVRDTERLDALPRHFGGDLLRVESAVFVFMRRLSSTYRGGFWKFVELSNGGFYMAPVSEGSFAVRVDTNGYEGEMSADATGITVCLFALSHLSFEGASEAVAEHFHLLRDFALQHPESPAIFAAID